MSRKHFQSLAITYGLGLRHARHLGPEWEQGYRAAVIDTALDLGSHSATFRRETFLEWVEDVADGRRDATGAKVKTAKVSA